MTVRNPAPQPWREWAVAVVIVGVLIGGSLMASVVLVKVTGREFRCALTAEFCASILGL